MPVPIRLKRVYKALYLGAYALRRYSGKVFIRAGTVFLKENGLFRFVEMCGIYPVFVDEIVNRHFKSLPMKKNS